MTDAFAGFPHVYWMTIDAEGLRAGQTRAFFDAHGIGHTAHVAVRGDHSRLSWGALECKLSKAQLGCMASHLACVQALAAGPDEFAIVAEDDIAWAGSAELWRTFVWRDVVGVLPSYAPSWDMIFLHQLCTWKAQFHARLGPAKVPQPTLGMDKYCAMAYLVRRSFARALVAALYDPESRTWCLDRIPSIRSLGTVQPIDVTWADHVQSLGTGPVLVYSVPLIFDGDFMDSTLTTSGAYLRFRRAGGRAARKTYANPGLVFRAEFAKAAVSEFRTELLAVGAAAGVAILALALWKCRS